MLGMVESVVPRSNAEWCGEYWALWIRFEILSQEMTRLNSFVILSRLPEYKLGESWALRFDSNCVHQVSVTEEQRDQTKSLFCEL